MKIGELILQTYQRKNQEDELPLCSVLQKSMSLVWNMFPILSVLFVQ